VTGRGLRVRAWLCPVPPRHIPGRRALSVAFRTAHLATFGVLLGGHVLGVEPARLTPFLVGTAVSGVLLAALDLASTCEWLLEGRGLAVAAKLGILALVPWFWQQRVPLLLLVVVVASVGAHMPGRFRHHSFRRSGRARGRVERPERAGEGHGVAAPAAAAPAAAGSYPQPGSSPSGSPVRA
jgi:hypothetical protein